MNNLDFTELQYNIYGSKSSIDTDIFVKLDLSPEDFKNTKEMQDLRFALKKYFLKFYKDPNINIGIVKNGIITHCVVGLPDELNNAVYYTYKLHKQKHKILVDVPVVRDKYSKIHKTLISVLSYFSRTSFRKDVKSALKTNDVKIIGNTIIRLFSTKEFINELEYLNVLKNISKTEIYKKIYFKVLLTSLLLDDIEVYTKEEVAKYSDVIGKRILYRDFPIDNLDLYMCNFIIFHINKIIKK